jgi:DNA excision repair protein ERCC-2
MDLFPYPPRPHQAEFVRSVAARALSGGHIVLESGTGTGKTVCSLAGALQASLPLGRKVLYLTRTNSQEKQVITELRRMNAKAPLFGVALQGRSATCPLAKNDPDLKGGNPEELSRICREMKRKALADNGGCRYYRATCEIDHDGVEAHCRRELPTAEEFVDYCEKFGLCPHELMKELAAKADVVAAPYAYFFVPFIRNSLLAWMETPMSELVVVIDEAHNLPDYTREIESSQMSERGLSLAENEMHEYGDPDLVPGMPISALILEFKEQLALAQREYLIEDDGLIPPGLLEEALMSNFRCSNRALETAAKALMEHGEIVREQKMAQNRLPRSYLFSLGAFLSHWISLEEDLYVKLIIGGDNPAFKAYCLDPVVTTSALLTCHCTVHMSGTLAPLPEYRDSIGLPLETDLRTYPSPFPPGNKLVLYTEDMTTKFEELADEEMVGRMQETVVQICNTVKRNTVVFFPSYSLMERFIEDGILKRLKVKAHLESRGMEQGDLMDLVTSFKSQVNGGVLFSVIGGRISEGIDFPDRELQVAIIIGLPFPKPTAKQRALMHYYDRRFRRGWEYTVTAPMLRKTQQAIGRLIRTETDVGAAVILDKRAKGYADRLGAQPSELPLNDVLNFFAAKVS